LLLTAFLNLRDPLLPGVGLDASWVLATDHAVKTGAVFGRDFVFTYGPYFRLATRLFEPGRFGLVLAFDLITPLMLAAPALINRSFGGMTAIAAALLVFQPSTDSLVMAAFLAVFLAALQRPGGWTLLLVALCGPLVLSKLSFALVLGPLMLLADATHARGRRWPAFTPVLAVSAVLSLIAAHQPLSALPDFAANSLAIILGYGHAMQLPGPYAEAALALLLSAGVLGLYAWRLAARGAHALVVMAAVCGAAWFFFIAFKAGFVRQDGHPAITFEAIVLGSAVLIGALCPASGQAARDRARTRIAAAIWVLAAAACFVAKSAATDRAASPWSAAALQLDRAVKGAPARLGDAASWLTGARQAEMTRRRDDALNRLRRVFPAAVTGSVDVIPYDLSEVIGSGLDYRPRPVPQSYSSYTPELQRRDAAHFAGPSAPDTLLLKLIDIDNRLPTLAVGPSLPVIAARYDAVGMDPLGIVLRRRAAPRPVRMRELGVAALPLNAWVDLPRMPGVVMGRFDIRPTLPAKLAGFLFRDPLLAIHLRGASGQVRTYRFVPGMAQAGVAISPMPAPGGLGALLLLSPQANLPADPVVAVMIEGHRWAYGDAKVALSAMERAPAAILSLSPGFALKAALTLSDPSGRAALEAGEIFAHAPTTLKATVTAPIVLEGVVGIRPHPPGPTGDGVAFSIAQIDAAGRERVLFRRTLPDGPSQASVRVTLTPGTRVVLRTDARGNVNFDWSYWNLHVPAAG
jgi:hypothetical protein